MPIAMSAFSVCTLQLKAAQHDQHESVACRQFDGFIGFRRVRLRPNGVQTVYVESFRQGPVRIAEHMIEVNLTAEKPKLEARIKDTEGNERYVLSLIPRKADEQDPGILSWRVQLIDLQRRALGNLLLASPERELPSTDVKNQAWWLDPGPYAVVPLRTVRVFKVENFYCVVQVKEHHFLVPERLLMDSMKVEIQFTNTNPLNAAGANDTH